MLHCQLHHLAVLQQGHHCLLVSDHPDVCRVHGQHSVSHPQLSSGSRGATRDDLADVDALEGRGSEVTADRVKLKLARTENSDGNFPIFDLIKMINSSNSKLLPSTDCTSKQYSTF